MCLGELCRCFGLLLWYLLGGIELALLWFILSILMAITIIGLIFGWAKDLFQIGMVCLYPEGWEIKRNEMCGLCGCTCIANIIWMILFGWEMFCFHMICWIIFWILQCCNIQLADYHWELAWLSLAPFGSEIMRAGSKVSQKP